MLHARALRDHLPQLRRHAYLFTGSRMAADCAVSITVARLPRDADQRPHAEGPEQLYRLLHEAASQLVCPPDGRLPPLHQRVLGLPPPQRAVLLLVSVERLPLRVAAEICGMEADAAAGALAAARAHLDARFTPMFSRST